MEFLAFPEPRRQEDLSPRRIMLWMLEAAVQFMRFALDFLLKLSLDLEAVKLEGYAQRWEKVLASVSFSTEGYISSSLCKTRIITENNTLQSVRMGLWGMKSDWNHTGAFWCGGLSSQCSCIPLFFTGDFLQLLVSLSYRVFSHLCIWRILIIQHFSIKFLCSGRQPPSQQVSRCCLQDTCQLFWLPVLSAS